MAQIFVSPWAQYTDANGNPGSGDKLYFYATGSSTPSTIYSDVGLTTPQANPAIADSAGQWPAIYLDDTLHKVVMATAADVTIRTVDPVFTVATGSKGADIPSATALNVGSNNDYFHVTGTVSITSITTRTAGTRITLEFDGILTITHNASNLILPGAANIITHAGYMAEFVSEGSGNWRYVVYEEVTPWVAYTPTISAGFGTCTNVSFYSRKNGPNTVEIEGRFTAGTVAASVASVTVGFNGVNGGVSIDPTRYATFGFLVGQAVCSSITGPITVTAISTPVVLTFGLVSGSAGLSASNGNVVCGNNQAFAFNARVQVV